MIKNFVFTVGLPGSGKSSWINDNYPEIYGFSQFARTVFDFTVCHAFFEYDAYGKYFIESCSHYQNVIVSADDVKPFLEGYSDQHPETVHEESVKIARKFVEELCKSCDFDGTVVMDGGGINHHYTQNIVEYVKNVCPNAHVTAVFFDTPIEVCLKRIEKRDRKVPLESIYNKNQMVVGCVNRYKAIADEFIRVDYYTNKYVLLDMDGTIAGYSKVRYDEEGNADFVNGELFLHLRPNKSVIEFIKQHYDMKNVYICTACANLIAWKEKCAWLDKYFPEIPEENRYWCGNKDYKYVFVKQFVEHMRWKRNEVVLIDDYHPTIDKCKKVGINCLHPSNIEALDDPYAIFS